MKIFFMIGWRNLWRNKRRSLVVITAISLGIFSMLLAMGIMNGMNNQMVENTIKTSLGHVAIHYDGFHNDMKLKYSFKPQPQIMKAVKDNEYMKHYTKRVKFEAMIRSSEASQGVMIMGIDPENEKKVSSIYEYTLQKEGSSFLESPDSDEILISTTMADKLDLLVGDRLVVMFQNTEKELVGNAFTVKGLFETPISSFDKYVVYTGINTLQKMTGLDNRISEISVITNKKEQVDKAAAQMRSELSGNNLEILTWKDMAPSLVRSVALFDTMMYVFFAIIFITVIFSIANTLIMAIMERFHEIGVMKSIGTRPSWIGGMVMFEAVNLGLVGLGAGMAAAILVISMLGATGIDFGFYAESMRMWGTGTVIYPSLKTMDFVVSALIVFANTIIAAVYPAMKAARIKPLDALHYV